MNVDLVFSLGRVGSERGASFLAGAIASHMRRSLESGSEAHEDAAGRLADCLLDTLCSMRALDASRAGRGDVGEASVEAGESMLRLMSQLRELMQDAIGESDLTAARAAAHETLPRRARR